jgi:hypothetical protein
MTTEQSTYDEITDKLENVRAIADVLASQDADAAVDYEVTARLARMIYGDVQAARKIWEQHWKKYRKNVGIPMKGMAKNA